MACYTAQLVDISIYLWIRKITRGKYLWLRNNGSTAISLLVDTSIVISFMCVFGALLIDKMETLIIIAIYTSYSLQYVALRYFMQLLG